MHKNIILIKKFTFARFFYHRPHLLIMEQFLELLKYTIPGLVVFATAYFLFQQYFNSQLRSQQLALRGESLKTTIPLRLQAYERMMLLCDRISVQNVLLRVQMPGMTVRELRGALLIAINQEFQHNTAQQLYISNTLWKILTVAKEDTMNLVSQIAPDLAPEADANLLANALLSAADQLGDNTSLVKAMTAIRTEAGELF